MASDARGVPASRDAFRARCAATRRWRRSQPSIRSEVLAQLAGLQVKELELTSFAGAPVYLATLAGGDDADRAGGWGADCRIRRRSGSSDVVTKAAAANGARRDPHASTSTTATISIAGGERPLPVILARLNDAEQTRYYIDPKTARVVGTYSSSNWMSRWLYHGLHSLDFPWLYNYRPLWDIVVITFMVGGTALCVTSLVLAWRVLGRKVRAIVPQARVGSGLSEDLA